MILVRAILKGVADDKPLENHILVASPVRDLIEQYNKIALHNDNLPKILSATTGKELKQAVGQLEPEEQVDLLYKYRLAIKSIDQPDEYRQNPDMLERRQMRLFLFRVAVIFLACACFVMIGATITVAVKSGTLPNDGVLKTIVSTAGDIIKFILSSPK